MAVNYAQLATEINTDPKALGYAGKGDYDIATLLNTAGASGETIFRAYTPLEDVVAGIVRAEYDALSTAAKTFLNDVILKGTQLKTGDANLRASVAGIFAAGTATRTNLTNIASKSATRAEVLFGEHTTVSDLDVAHALGRG